MITESPARPLVNQGGLATGPRRRRRRPRRSTGRPSRSTPATRPRTPTSATCSPPRPARGGDRASPRRRSRWTRAAARPGRTWGCPRWRSATSTRAWRRSARRSGWTPRTTSPGTPWAARCSRSTGPPRPSRLGRRGRRPARRRRPAHRARHRAGRAGPHGEAVRVLHRATAPAPDSARAWTQLGVVSLVRQDHGRRARPCCGAGPRPGRPDARFHLAVLHVLVGAVEEARESLSHLVREPGEHARQAAELLARITGDGVVTAAEDLQAAIRGGRHDEAGQQRHRARLAPRGFLRPWAAWTTCGAAARASRSRPSTSPSTRSR